jgi:hydroxymethylglutaryl-CoA reductase (NADPH)
MPISKEQARQIVERLSKGAPLESFRPRFAPVSPDERPLPPDVPRPSDWSAAAAARRLEFIERTRGIQLPHLAGRTPRPDPEWLRGNIEQYVGMAQVPVGLIGPLRINGFHAHGDYYVPLATSEGALVASYHRGARIASRAGGIATLTTSEQVQRAPGFAFENLGQAARFAAWSAEQFESFRQIAATRTSHGRLTDLLTHIETNHVYLILSYHTGDAAGQNMVTLCTAAICEHILAHTPVPPRYWFLESNMSGDKKANVLSFLNTRGRNAMAEVVLPRRLVERALHTSPERMCDYWRMSFVGGAQTGSIGVSGHVANGLAAMFLACGQDVACVSEASVGLTRMELTPGGDLYCGLTLPNLIVGTVGGGTRLPTAQECLAILDCAGSGKASAFAEVCAATALAGEISIIAALCSGDFASAHERLGRRGEGGPPGVERARGNTRSGSGELAEGGGPSRGGAQ